MSLQNGITRRDMIRLVGTAAVMAIVPGFLLRDAAAADLVDGKSVHYTLNSAGSTGYIGKYQVNDTDCISLACPHRSIPEPVTGTYTAYDLDKNPSLLQSPRSGLGTPARTPQEVLRVWKMIAYYGYAGPGYSANWWKATLANLDVAGADLSREAYRVSTVMHNCFSYWWFNDAEADFGVNINQIRGVIEALQSKANADGHPESGMRIHMLAVPSGRQEIIYWTHEPTGFIRVRKDLNV